MYGRKIAACLSLTALLAVRAEELPRDFDQVNHYSCLEAWEASEDRPIYFETLIGVSAAHVLRQRQLTFPDTEEAGRALGHAVTLACEHDPQELLFSVVNRALLQVLDDLTQVE